MRISPAQFLLLLFISMVTCVQGAALAADRAPILAGRWYPADPEELRHGVQAFIDGASGGPQVQGRLVGLVAPHAGHVYSGAIAGAAYALLATSKADTLVIVAPSHRHAFKGVSVYDKGGYETPLGTVQLDEEFIAAMRATWPGLGHVSEAHAQEHAVEIQIPFLQVALPQAKLVPLVMGTQDIDTCAMLSLALTRGAQASKGRVVLLASSDLSHFHSKTDAAKRDSILRDAVQGFDAASVYHCLSTQECEACGGGPIIAVMQASRELGADSALVLAHGDSGDVSGDNDRVVGYMAAVFFEAGGRGGSPEPAADAEGDAGEYAAEERALLLGVARESVRTALDGKDYIPPKDVPAKLQEVRGAFVTLKKHGELRGCIGTIIGRLPLVSTVANMARAAAFEDPRFENVRPEEYDDLEFEISVLTVPQVVNDPAKVVVGRHGLIMTRGWSKGLLLPQVPAEYGWDRETFLGQTCRKAGLPPHCWQDKDTVIEVFSAEVF